MTLQDLNSFLTGATYFVVGIVGLWVAYQLFLVAKHDA